MTAIAAHRMGCEVALVIFEDCPRHHLEEALKKGGTDLR
jgi:hypothetical protein